MLANQANLSIVENHNQFFELLKRYNGFNNMMQQVCLIQAPKHAEELKIVKYDTGGNQAVLSKVNFKIPITLEFLGIASEDKEPAFYLCFSATKDSWCIYDNGLGAIGQLHERARWKYVVQDGVLGLLKPNSSVDSSYFGCGTRRSSEIFIPGITGSMVNTAFSNLCFDVLEENLKQLQQEANNSPYMNILLILLFAKKDTNSSFFVLPTDIIFNMVMLLSEELNNEQMRITVKNFYFLTQLLEKYQYYNLNYSGDKLGVKVPISYEFLGLVSEGQGPVFFLGRYGKIYENGDNPMEIFDAPPERRCASGDEYTVEGGNFYLTRHTMKPGKKTEKLDKELVALDSKEAKALQKLDLEVVEAKLQQLYQEHNQTQSGHSPKSP